MSKKNNIDQYLDTIIEGDCTEKMKDLPDSSVDLIFCDPPYWMRVEGTLTRAEGTAFNGCQDDWDQFSSLSSYEDFTRSWLEECKRVLKPNGSLWVIGGMQCIYTIGGIMQDLDWWLLGDIVWQKTNATPNFKGTRFANSHETLIWATKSKKAKYCFHYKTAKEMNHDNVDADAFAKGKRKQMGSVWRLPVCTGAERLKGPDGKKLHTTQKPEALLARVIALTSNEGDIILDPFGGTMTTAAVAKKLGRHYIAIEMDKTYIEAGKARLDAIGDYEATDISKATFDIKPKRVSMEEMIEAGYFKEGETFYLKASSDEDTLPVLTKKGKLKTPDGEVKDMHSLAATYTNSSAKRLNGFSYWYVKREGELIPIAKVREDYRESLEKGEDDEVS